MRGEGVGRCIGRGRAAAGDDEGACGERADGAEPAGLDGGEHCPTEAKLDHLSEDLRLMRFGDDVDGCADPAKGKVIKDLLSLRFKRLMEEKFDTDLSDNPAVVLMMGNTTGHYNEGYAHPDSKHKIITVIVGFSREWPYERGRLRVLRSADRNDSAFEFAPEYGSMLMFRVCDHSWHGFLPQKGPRMSLQLCFVDSEAYVRSEYWRHGVSAFAKSMPLLRKVIDWAPRLI